MNKSSKRKGNWWQRISTSGKVFCVIGIVCIFVTLIIGYFVKLSDPTASSAINFMMAFCIFENAIIMAGTVIARLIDTTNLDEIRGEVVKNLKDAHRVHKDTVNFIQFDRFDSGLESEDRLAWYASKPQAGSGAPPNEVVSGPVLSAEDLAAIDAEIKAKRESDEMAGYDALAARHAKSEEKHQDYLKAQRQAAKGENKEPEGKPVEGSGDNNPEESLAKKGDDRPNNVIVAHISPGEHTGGPNVEIIKNAAHDAVGENQPENQPDSPEKYPSIQQQAEELGVTIAELKFYLRGKPHYSLIPYADLKKLLQLARMRA